MRKHLELSLCALGWLIATVSVGMKSYPLMEAACVALGLTGTVRIGKLILDRKRHWALCNIIGGAAMPSYFFGAVITLAQYNPNSPDFVLPGGDDFLINALLAIVYLSLFYWALAGLAVIENGYWQKALDRIDSDLAWRRDQTIQPAITFALGGLAAIQGGLILTGGVTLGGVDVSQDTRLPVGTMLVIGFSDPALAIAAWIIGRWRRPLIGAQIAIASTIGQIVWLGGLGRRFILYGAVIFLTFFFWGRGRKRGGRVLLLAVPTLAIVYISTKIFVAMRYASYSYGDVGAAPSLSLLYSDALSLLSTDYDQISEAEADNYSSRFFILGHLTTVMSLMNATLAQFGKFLFISFLTCIPSVIWPEKTDLMARLKWAGEGKGLLNDILGLPQLDNAWTPFVAAFADYMWLGALIYPLFFLLLGWIFSRIIGSLRYPSFIIGALGLCFMEFISTEVGVTAFILAGRTLVFLWIVAKLVEYVYPTRAD